MHYPKLLNRKYETRRHHRYIFEEKEQRKAGEKTKKKRVIARLQVISLPCELQLQFENIGC